MDCFRWIVQRTRFHRVPTRQALPIAAPLSVRHLYTHRFPYTCTAILPQNDLHTFRHERRRSNSTLEVLRQQVELGVLQSDPAQERVAKRLTRLEQALVGYDNAILFQREREKEEKNKSSDSTPKPNASIGDEISPNSQEGVKEEEESEPPIRIPRGLYIHGPVGTGKSMLMDSFYNNAPVVKKERFHFHRFLSQVHTQIHQLKQLDLQTKGRNFFIDTRIEHNPIHRVGKQLAEQVSLLCLDEFQVTDIADAVILSQLFSVLFSYGTVVVATSNRPPQDLYEGGLNRSYFLPFIDLLQQHCIVYHVPSQRDYRRILSNCSSFFVNDQRELERMMRELTVELIEEDGGTVSGRSIELPVGFQRTILVSRVYGGVETKDEDELRNRPIMACFDFEELCDKDRGASDYRAIANAFDIVVVENVPTLDVEGHNRARRFITLIDELYEAKCAILCCALEAKTPTELFRGNNKNQNAIAPSTEKPIDSNETKTREEEILWVDVAQEGGTPVGALASVRELAFAFERASSRIFEMSSSSWWDRVLKR
ncbi:AFG1-like ATPase-domain containing protein [Nitzschia inconspicua]|uniref:AFG1-like ATPase-domain containing protein n=1 Tax=Nitzschia inconspicua TaxID=303405 RepID=A0A9K3LIZ9_9STRA|nr:AFG1-like ATPase-domain containing protein [Nitzschia inconspicua]